MKKVWIDLDNSPHVPFFNPIIKTLEQKKYAVSITARDCFQVIGLAELLGLRYKKIGRHYGKHKILKVAGTIIRSLQLIPTAARIRPDLAISHGSRSQLLAAKLLKIPVAIFDDYEFAQEMGFIRPDYLIRPIVIPFKRSGLNDNYNFKYQGIKEDVYVPFFKPDSKILKDLKISKDKILVTIRPPATEAHYHNPESEKLFVAAVEFIADHPDTIMVLLPRNETKQTAWIRNKWKAMCNNGRIIIPDHVVNGLNLIWHSDLVISGGGTMNREAAALKVPVYSIFRGKIGAVDHYLVKDKRLKLITTIKDVKDLIKIKKRDKKRFLLNDSSTALNTIMRLIENFSTNI